MLIYKHLIPFGFKELPLLKFAEQKGTTRVFKGDLPTPPQIEPKC